MDRDRPFIASNKDGVEADLPAVHPPNSSAGKDESQEKREAEVQAEEHSERPIVVPVVRDRIVQQQHEENDNCADQGDQQSLPKLFDAISASINSKLFMLSPGGWVKR